jgi:L-lysine 2,3-aminomutase
LPQFVGMSALQCACREADNLGAYIQENPEVTDLLFRGVDLPMMSSSHIAACIEPLLSANLPKLRRIGDHGKHLTVVAHFNLWRELQPGAVIRTQSPVLRHINDEPLEWARLWNEQVDLECIPYYLHVCRQQYRDAGLFRRSAGARLGDFSAGVSQRPWLGAHRAGPVNVRESG